MGGSLFPTNCCFWCETFWIWAMCFGWSLLVGSLTFHPLSSSVTTILVASLGGSLTVWKSSLFFKKKMILRTFRSTEDVIPQDSIGFSKILRYFQKIKHKGYHPNIILKKCKSPKKRSVGELHLDSMIPRHHRPRPRKDLPLPRFQALHWPLHLDSGSKSSSRYSHQFFFPEN